MTTPEPKSLEQTFPAADAKASVEDTAAMYARALEACQGINEMIFAALKMKGRNLHARSRSLPLTIIGGFLGSGKTTLLNHLLVSPHGRRLVVLVNDFGRINIDAALLASQTEDMVISQRHARPMLRSSDVRACAGA